VLADRKMGEMCKWNANKAGARKWKNRVR